VAVGKTSLALRRCRNPESGESHWLGGGDVESSVRGTQGSGESPWFGGGPVGEVQELLSMSVSA